MAESTRGYVETILNILSFYSSKSRNEKDLIILKIKQHYFLKIKQKLFGKIIPSSVQNNNI